MKRRTILPCWCFVVIAGGERHEVVQTGVCDMDKATDRIRRYFMAERKQPVERIVSCVRMNEHEAKKWLAADDAGNVGRDCSCRSGNKHIDTAPRLIPLRHYEP